MNTESAVRTCLNHPILETGFIVVFLVVFPWKLFLWLFFFHEPNARRFIGCNSAAVDDDAEVSAAFNRSKEVHQSTLLTKES